MWWLFTWKCYRKVPSHFYPHNCHNSWILLSTACHNRKCVTADGVQRGILSINFQLPGPSLQVCKDDLIVVDVRNEAEGLSTSMHFHGMRQIDTPFMDGVPYLTQCPIPYGSTFRYAFHAKDGGTHFYHSHSGYQKIDGLFGEISQQFQLVLLLLIVIWTRRFDCPQTDWDCREQKRLRFRLAGTRNSHFRLDASDGSEPSPRYDQKVIVVRIHIDKWPRKIFQCTKYYAIRLQSLALSILGHKKSTHVRPGWGFLCSIRNEISFSHYQFGI